MKTPSKASWIIGGAGLLVSAFALGSGVNLGNQMPVKDAASVDTSVIAQPSSEALDNAIRDYLMRNPEVISEAQVALADRQAEQAAQAQQTAIAELSDAIFNDPSTPLVGNLDGDVTVVEFFDYNCGFCKRAHDDFKTVLARDPNVKFALKEFPILGPDSFAAHMVAIAFERLYPEKYGDFHGALLSSPSRADEAAAMTTALALGADETALLAAIADPETEQTAADVYSLAQSLGITGTPAYVIGNQVISGALGAEVLLERIEAARAQAQNG